MTNYSVAIWNDDELLKVIDLKAKRLTSNLKRIAKCKALFYIKENNIICNCVDLCKNGDAYINLYSWS